MLDSAKGTTISRVAIARRCPKISHLFIADDNLVFLKATDAKFETFQAIMVKYEKASGQCINPSKSMVFFSKNVPTAVRSALRNKLNMKEVDNLEKYLGWPSLFNSGKVKDFKFLIDKV